MPEDAGADAFGDPCARDEIADPRPHSYEIAGSQYRAARASAVEIHSGLEWEIS